MAKVVRVAVPDDESPIRWPNVCAACGTGRHLVPIALRVVRPGRHTPPGQKKPLRRTSWAMYFPACPRHAAQVRHAHVLWEHGPLSLVLRSLILLCALPGVAALVQAVLLALDIASPVVLHPSLRALGLAGLAGVAYMLLMRRGLVVRSLGFDPDMDVFRLHFVRTQYALLFQMANPRLTDAHETAPRAWWRSGHRRRRLLLGLEVALVLVAGIAWLVFSSAPVPSSLIALLT